MAIWFIKTVKKTQLMRLSYVMTGSRVGRIGNDVERFIYFKCWKINYICEGMN